MVHQHGLTKKNFKVFKKLEKKNKKKKISTKVFPYHCMIKSSVITFLPPPDPDPA